MKNKVLLTTQSRISASLPKAGIVRPHCQVSFAPDSDIHLDTRGE